MSDYNEIHPDLAVVLNAEGIPESEVGRRYSDAYIDCKNYGQAIRIKKAGIWSSMALVFTNQVTSKPCVEVPLAYLGHLVSSRKKQT